MLLSTQHLKIFPNATSDVSLNDIRYFMTSMFGDGVIRGFEPSIVNDAIILTPGSAVVDGVIVECTTPITLPYSLSIDKDVVLVNKFSEKYAQSPEIRENYTGENPFVYLYSIMNGNLSYSKRQWSVSSKDPRAFGFSQPAAYYNALIGGGIADLLHKHAGIYRVGVVEYELPDNSIIKIPVNAVATFVNISTLKTTSGATVHCYITAEGRVRCYSELNGAVIDRGYAKVRILTATYGSSGEKV